MSLPHTIGRSAWLTAIVFSVSSASAEPFDATAVSTIPIMAVIRIATEPYQDGGQKGGATLPPSVRTLTRLAALDRNLITLDGRTTIYSVDQRNVGAFVTALQDAGLPREAAAFRTAAAGAEPTPDMPGATAEGAPKLMTLALGETFATKASFEDAIVVYARTHAEAAEWCETARRTLPDEDRLYALEEMLARVPNNAEWSTIEAWPEPYRQVQLVSIFEGQLSNGGVWQYFWNASGSLAPATVGALRAMDLPRQADVIGKGIALFDAPYPIDTGSRRHLMQIHALGDAMGGKLAGLSAEADLDGITPAMTAFAKQRGILPR